MTRKLFKAVYVDFGWLMYRKIWQTWLIFTLIILITITIIIRNSNSLITFLNKFQFFLKNILLKLILSSIFQSTDIEFRHELMNRLNKLDTDVELEILPSQQDTSVSPSSQAVYGGSYDSYGNVKEYYCGNKNFKLMI